MSPKAILYQSIWNIAPILNVNFNRCLLTGDFFFFFLQICKALYCSTNIIKFCKCTHALKVEMAEDVQDILIIIFAVTVHCSYCS